MGPLRKMLLVRSEMYTYNIQMSVAIKIAPKGMKIAHAVHLITMAKDGIGLPKSEAIP